MEMFTLRGKDPQSWLEQATGQRMVADLVLKRFWEVTKAQEASDRQRVEQLACMKTYMMLLGLSFENLAKAILITRNPSLVTEAKLEKWSDQRGGHGFAAMIRAILGETSAGEADLLARLEEYVVWAGRYPIPKTSRDYKRAEQVVGFRFNGSDPELADQLFNRLKSLVGTYDS